MQNAEQIGLGKDHITIAKFDHDDDPDFKIVALHLSQMAKTAPLQIVRRWEGHGWHEGG